MTGVRARVHPPLRRGEQVGRFVLLDQVGRGGVGVVWSAYDPELDRKVAIKFLATSAPSADSESDSAGRFRREAQLMAKLRHPNVVTVFEVGRHEGELFLAMEFVTGGTLRAFAAERRKDDDGYEKIVAAYVGAARGLAAAHAVGVVHGDFKPANVLISEGRPQVADFGLARSPEGEPEAPESEAGSEAHTPGTPRYMAPELMLGLPASEASDQFAFCVSLYESLTGESPFEGETLQELQASLTDNRRRPRPRTVPLPPWLWDLIDRGLSLDPQQRWASMTELADALEQPERAGFGAGPRTVAGVVAGLLALGGSVPLVVGPASDDAARYAEALAVPVVALLCLAGVRAWARHTLAASKFNAKAVAGLFAFFGCDLALWLLAWARGLPFEQTYFFALLLWGSLAAMFAVLFDRRALWLTIIFFAGSACSLVWIDALHVFNFVGTLGFLALVYTRWKHNPP